jgi:outer membrane protein assembly factor BamB
MRYASLPCILAAAGCLLLSSGVRADCQSVPPPSKFVESSTVREETISPRLEMVRNVSTNLWTFNALDSYDPAWHSEVFYITSFVIGGNPPQTGQLIELDYRRNRAVAWTIPAGIGSWGLIKGQDGNLYMGSYNEGKLMCFDPRTKTWLPMPQASAEFRRQNPIITDLVQAPDGRIYFGTFPEAHLARYDPHTKTVEDLGKVAGEKYVRWLAVTRDGIILCGVGPRHARVIAYDPRIRSFRTLTPKEDQTPGAFSKPLASDRYVIEAQHNPGGKVLVYDPATLKLLHVYRVPLRNNGSGNQSIFTLVDPTHVLYQDDKLRLMQLDLATGARSVVFADPDTAANNRWYFDRNGNVLGLLVQSYVYLDRATGKVTHAPIPIPHPAQDILWLNTAPDGTIYGGPPFGQNMFGFDPKRHRLTSFDQVVDRTGEIYYGIPYDGKIYNISYAEGILSVFDPRRPWDPGLRSTSNPRTILFLGDDQYRPVGGIHLGPGHKMYIGTQPDYGLLGGALSIFSPATGSIETLRNIIPGEEISAIATDDRYVYCEADPSGGMGAVPTATQIHFFVWDPVNRRIVFDQALPKGGGFNSIAAVDGHAYFVTGSAVMEYDATRRSLSTLLRVDHPVTIPPESLKAAKDGTIFGIFGDQLGRIEPAARRLQLYPETAGRATSGLAIGLDGAVYFGSYTDLGIYHPQSASGPAAFGN